MSSFWRLLVFVTVAAVLASACSGASLDGVDTTADGASFSADTSGGVPIAGPIVEKGAMRAQRLADRLGDTDGAMDALLLGGEFGYSGPQLLTAVDSATLQLDGVIQGVEPAGPPLGRIVVDGKSGQLSETGKVAKRPASRALAMFQNVSDDKILLERLRDLATDSGAFEFERSQVLGIEGLSLILVMLDSGFTPEQIIDALILGVYFFEQDGDCYSQTLPLNSNRPEIRVCDDAEPGDENSTDVEVTEPEDGSVPAEPAIGASYVGSLDNVLVEDPASSIVVTISPEGAVSGQLNATEHLDNYIGSIDLCGIVGDDEDCDDGVDSCSATVLWFSDLSSLTFTGTPPDSGIVTGPISISWDTTPDGCGEASTEITTFDIEATVSPDDAQITVPLEIDLLRVQPPG